MKKLLFAFLFAILGISLTTSGVLLFGGCSSSQPENGGEGTFAPPQDEEESEKSNDDEDSNSDVVQLGYTATVSFNKNCSDTVTNMPSTARKTQQNVSIIVGASGWTISVTIGRNVPERGIFFQKLEY